LVTVACFRPSRAKDLSAFRYRWDLIVLVAEGCSAVLFALAMCLTVPNTWSINLTTDLLAWCICTKETLAGNNIRKHSSDVVDCIVIRIT
jgi:hypothetical protein